MKIFLSIPQFAIATRLGKMVSLLFVSILFFSSNSFSQNWSDAATWGGTKPTAGQEVTIPAGTTIILDENTPELGGLIIAGKLQFARADLSLTADYIFINGGELAIGSVAQPFQQKAVITVKDTDTNFNLMGHMGTRGIMVMNNGVLNLHGASPQMTWTKINDHAPDGATALTLAQNPGWKAGDEIIVGPTDIYEAANGKSITQKIAISTINNNSVTLAAPLEAFHWGKLQYATADGLSLTQSNLVTNPQYKMPFSLALPSPPKILDERAAVGNLTRNIVIQAPDDDLWRNQGFGVHIMLMHEGVKAFVNGVEIKRAGQRGRVRRYPFHWHMLSYQGSQTLSDATGQYFKNSTINESENRGVVIHGTNGVAVQNNVIFSTKGHAIFTEDAVERRNLIDKNLVLKVRSPADEDAIKNHEKNKKSSGLWLSNPDNTVTHNHFGDIEGHGAWLAFPVKPFGESSEVLYEDGEIMNPRRMLHGIFDYNTFQSCRRDGLHNDNPEIDEEGNTGGSGMKDYESTTTGRHVPWPYTNRRRFTIKGNAAWKCSGNGQWERATWVNNVEAISADNGNRCFAGSGFEGLIAGSLAVGESLNVGMNSNTFSQIYPAFASYHHTFQFVGNLIYNFPAQLNKESGAFSTVDYYIRPVESGHFQSNGNVLVNSHPGVKITAAEGWGEHRVDPNNPHFNLAGAIKDKQGFWGGEPGSYFVFDDPFYTYGQTPVLVPGYSAELSGGVSVEGPFYGLDNIHVDGKHGTHELFPDMQVIRYNANWENVGSLRIEGSDDAPSTLLPHMKDFALQKDGFYELFYPDYQAPTDSRISVTNMHHDSDKLLLGIEFDGKTDAKIDATNGNLGFPKIYASYTEVNSLHAVQNSDGDTFWQDAVRNKIWLKAQGGHVNKTWDEYNPEDSLYQQFMLHVRSTGFKNQIISAARIADQLPTAAPFEFVATVDTGFELTYEINGPATLNGQMVTLDGSLGTVTITISQAGNNEYAATALDVIFEVTENPVFTGIDEKKLDISIYPNPTNDILHVETPQKDLTMQLFTMNGVKLMDIHPNTSNRIAHLNSGLYFLLVRNQQGSSTYKIIKN